MAVAWHLRTSFSTAVTRLLTDQAEIRTTPAVTLREGIIVFGGEMAPLITIPSSYCPFCSSARKPEGLEEYSVWAQHPYVLEQGSNHSPDY